MIILKTGLCKKQDKSNDDFSLLHRLGTVLEEIVLEEPGDADEHVEVDAGAFEKTFTIASFIKYFVFLRR